MTRSHIANAVAAFLVLLFTYTAVSKLIGYELFAGQLQHSPLFERSAGFMAVLIPIIELIVAWMLLFPITRTIGLIGSLLLLVAFTAYLLYMLLSRVKLPCTCGGIISALSWQQHVVFNTACILLNTLALVLYRHTAPCNPNLQNPPLFDQPGQAENL